MSPNDKIEELISAVGGVAEMCKVFYDSANPRDLLALRPCC